MTNIALPRTSSRTKPKPPKYGYYFFAPYIFMLFVFLAAGATGMVLGLHLDSGVVYYLGIFTALYGVLTTLGWALARYVIPGNRVTVARQIIAKLNLRGHEQTLDVGSGRGLYAIEAARMLSSGHVIGIDIWDPGAIKNLGFHHSFSQPTSNTIENARQNAKLAGVSNKVEFTNMDAAHLEFADKSFDLVTCGFVIGHLWRNQGNVLKEIRRVIKDDGRLVIIDNARDLTYFLLSTPHLFVWSYLRGRKAKRLSKQNWFNTITRSSFHISRWGMQKGIITIECTKT
jgi:arsenite methyltransferase